MCGSSDLPPQPVTLDPFIAPEDITGLSLGDIVYDNTARIHPLFQRKNFVPAWTDVEYDALAPILRLATVYLESVRSTRFLHTVFFGTLVPESYGQDILIDTVKGPLNSEQKNAVRVTLEILSEGVIDFEPKRTPHEGFDGFTKKHRDRFSPLPGGDVRGLWGRASTVVTDGTVPAAMLYHQSIRKTYGFTTENTRIALLYIHRHVRLFLHELAHAFTCARVAGCFEPHMETAGSASEMGFNYEHVVFGGLLEQFDVDMPPYYTVDSNGVVSSLLATQVLASHPWPKARTVNSYSENQQPLSVRGMVFNTQLELWSRTPLRKLAAQFTRAFWGNEGADESITAATLLAGPQMTPVLSVMGDLSDSFHVADFMMNLAGGYPMVSYGTTNLPEADLQLTALTLARKRVPRATAESYVKYCVQPEWVEAQGAAHAEMVAESSGGGGVRDLVQHGAPSEKAKQLAALLEDVLGMHVGILENRDL